MPASKGHSLDKEGKTTYLHAAKQFPFRTIVAAIDFSEESSAALRCAQELARLRHAMLLLVHVIDPVGYAFPGGAPPAVDHGSRSFAASIAGLAMPRYSSSPTQVASAL